MNHHESPQTIVVGQICNVRQNLESYLENPSNENILKTGISMHMLKSAYGILPKRSRTKKSDRLIATCVDFLSLNNTVRDYDIILQKLEQHGHDCESGIHMLTQKRKLKRLLKALELGQKISKTGTPKLKKAYGNTRLQKKTLAMIKAFRQYMTAIKDAQHVKELHLMRYAVKELQYVLVLYLDAHDNLASNLKLLEKILDYICDYDLFIRYLEKNAKRYPYMSAIITSEKEKRCIEHQKMVRTLINL